MTAQAGSITPTSDPARRRSCARRIRAEAPRAARTRAARQRIAPFTHTSVRYPSSARARRIASFLAFDGEPSLDAPSIDAARQQRKHVYVPVLRGADDDVRGARARQHARRRISSASWNRSSARASTPRELDLVLTPLVAFDDRGVRVGVGRGYYDRCFRFLRHRAHWRRPKLLGVAYELQHVAAARCRAAGTCRCGAS